MAAQGAPLAPPLPMREPTPLAKPATSTGIADWTIDPPRVAPQHLTPPLLISAQVKPCAFDVIPANTEVALEPSPATSTGAGLSVVDPLPSCPALFLPPHLMPPLLITAQK